MRHFFYAPDHRHQWRRSAGTRATLIALMILAAGTALRITIALRHSDSPAIDENEVVEQAAAFPGPT